MNNEQVCSKTETRHPSLAAKLRARDKYLEVSEVAALLGINKFTLYDWVKAGRIPAQRIGGRVKFDPWKLAAWLDKQSIAA
jgi:excisionase family DNA binding protein